MIANSMPVTRTVMEAGIRNNVIQFVETSAKGRESWGQAYTPVGLAKALFQLSDPDPAYKNVTGLPVDNLYADFDFGTLTYMYDMYLPNITSWQQERNVMQAIFPTTPVKLGRGFIIGQERIVTKMSGAFSWPKCEKASASSSPCGPRLRYYDRQGWLNSTSHLEHCEVTVSVDGTSRAFAIIDSSDMCRVDKFTFA